MQKWEYCAVGPIMSSGYLSTKLGITVYTTTGRTQGPGPAELKQVGLEEHVAPLVAKLGEEGWEMVCFSEKTSRFYFKRPKE